MKLQLCPSKCWKSTIVKSLITFIHELITVNKMLQSPSHSQIFSYFCSALQDKDTRASSKQQVYFVSMNRKGMFKTKLVSLPDQIASHWNAPKPFEWEENKLLGFRSRWMMLFACKYSIAREISSAKLIESFRSRMFGRMLNKYLWRVPPLISSVIITIEGSTEAPINCFNKAAYISIRIRCMDINKYLYGVSTLREL